MDENYTPTVPPMVRTVTYYLGVAATAAAFVFPEAPVLVRVGSAIGFVASVFGVAYRPTKG